MPIVMKKAVFRPRKMWPEHVYDKALHDYYIDAKL